MFGNLWNFMGMKPTKVFRYCLVYFSSNIFCSSLICLVGLCWLLLSSICHVYKIIITNMNIGPIIITLNSANARQTCRMQLKKNIFKQTIVICIFVRSTTHPVEQWRLTIHTSCWRGAPSSSCSLRVISLHTSASRTDAIHLCLYALHACRESTSISFRSVTRLTNHLLSYDVTVD